MAEEDPAEYSELAADVALLLLLLVLLEEYTRTEGISK